MMVRKGWSYPCVLAVGLGVLLASAEISRAGVVLGGGGLVLAEEGGTFDVNNWAGISTGAVPFTSSDLGPQIGIGFHVAANVNDETYGNSNSWIGGDANPYPRPFAGVAFAAPQTLAGFAFGRDNLNQFGDRNQGLYELQYTTVATPNAATADLDWTTIGTLNYGLGGLAPFTNPTLRHRFNFDAVSNVTGIRLVVPNTGLNTGTDIDELEAYSTTIEPPPPAPARIYTPSPGFAITPVGGDGPTVDGNPATVPANLALATNGAIAFGTSELGPQLGIPYHLISNLNDGLYGNVNSWIGGDGDATGAIGISLPFETRIDQIAWGRDNGNTDPLTDSCGGTCGDRTLGTYTLQYTLLPGADQSTADTGDPATGWATIGSVRYDGSDENFTSYLRHLYRLQKDGRSLTATAIRMLVPATGLNAGTDIDELELYKLQFIGDANDDGFADFSDLGILLNNYNQPGSSFEGDFDNSGTVEFADLGILLNNYNQANPVPPQALAGAAAPVPEPGSIALAGLGFIGLFAAGLRRRNT